MKKNNKLDHSFQTKLHFIAQVPSLEQLKQNQYESILIFDQFFLGKKKYSPWIKSFSYKIAVEAGEKLKTIEKYQFILEQLQKWQASGKINKPLQIIALGGGSIGDFAGFVASTYKRGVRLVHIPTTWLAAIDSSHGGKTGLNLNSVKNQIGSFYPASETYLSQQFLFSKNETRLLEAYGEFIKIAIINKPQLLLKFVFSEKHIFKNLKTAIQGKMQIVLSDPFEKTGVRSVLNLGHTMGHVYESILGLSHGRSVLLGLIFSLRWSYYKKLIEHDELLDLYDLILSLPLVKQDFESLKKLNNEISFKKIESVLRQDKKQSKSKIKFIFVNTLKMPKKTEHKIFQKLNVLVQDVTAEEIINEFKRQMV